MSSTPFKYVKRILSKTPKIVLTPNTLSKWIKKVVYLPFIFRSSATSRKELRSSCGRLTSPLYIKVRIDCRSENLTPFMYSRGCWWGWFYILIIISFVYCLSVSLNWKIFVFVVFNIISISISSCYLRGDLISDFRPIILTEMLF